MVFFSFEYNSKILWYMINTAIPPAGSNTIYHAIFLLATENVNVSIIPLFIIITRGKKVYARGKLRGAIYLCNDR